jgi:cytidine deaminase
MYIWPCGHCLKNISEWEPNLLMRSMSKAENFLFAGSEATFIHLKQQALNW